MENKIIVKNEDLVMIIDSLNVVVDNLKLTITYIQKAFEEKKKEPEELIDLLGKFYGTGMSTEECRDKVIALAIKKVDEIDDIDDWIETSEAKQQLEKM